MYTVYILKSLKDTKHYIGYTSDLDRRIEDHNRGKSKSVKHRGPFKLIYKECFMTKKEALFRERQIKRYKGGEAFKKLVMDDLSATPAGFDPAVTN